MAKNQTDSAQGKTFVAIYDLTAQENDDLSFNKGDKFLIVDCRKKDWWKAKSLKTQLIGYIPSNYVEVENSKSLPRATFYLSTPPSDLQPAYETMKALTSSSVKNSSPRRQGNVDQPLTHGYRSGNSSPPPRSPKKDNLRLQETRQPSPVENAYEIPTDFNTSPVAMNAKFSSSMRSGAADEIGYATPFSNIYDMASESWHFGGITKEQCELLLYKNEIGNGTFLVRESSTNPGQLCLSILLETEEKRQVFHYRLKENENGYFYVKDSVLFKSLDGLVRHYSALNDGLCCRLEKPCPKPKDKEKLWATSHDSIKCKEIIGEGHFGKVMKGVLYGFKEVAIKMIHKNDFKAKKEFLKEADVIKSLRHPNIVSFYGMVYDEPVWIITEFMSNGSLKSYLRTKTQSLQDQEKICVQIACGMAYLEENNFIHRDLRADNVLVSRDEICKIADFGLARILTDSIYQSENHLFPVKWTAPEAITHHEFSIKSDVWSYGVVLMEIFTRGGEPYPGMLNKEVTEQIARGYRMQKCVNCPQSVHDIILCCWEDRPEDRPSFKSLEIKFKNLRLWKDEMTGAWCGEV